VSRRHREGALSARKTPAPPAEAKLGPLPDESPFGLPVMSDSYPLDESERREIADLRAANARERGAAPGTPASCTPSVMDTLAWLVVVAFAVAVLYFVGRAIAADPFVSLAVFAAALLLAFALWRIRP
jgi:hypothetical protein